MDVAVLVLVLGAVAFMRVFWVIGLVSAIRMPRPACAAAKRSRTGTIIGIVLTGGVGALYYWFGIRLKLGRSPGEA